MDDRLKDLINNENNPAIVISDRYSDKLGCGKNTFFLEVTTCTEFRDIGIRDGSDIYIDPDMPFEEGEVSCFMRTDAQTGNNEFRLSRTMLDGYIYAGQLVLIITAVKGKLHGDKI